MLVYQGGGLNVVRLDHHSKSPRESLVVSGLQLITCAPGYNVDVDPFYTLDHIVTGRR